jgi:rubrerythrin
MRDACTCSGEGPCDVCRAYGVPPKGSTAHAHVKRGERKVRDRADELADALRREQEAHTREAQAEARMMAFARRHGITGAAAQRFLAGQRAARERQRQATRQAEMREGAAQLALLPDAPVRTRALLGCPGCGSFRAITTIPFRTPCCGYVSLIWEGRP